MRYAPRGPLLIEATCNQVNQFGGYTGMRPADFRALVYDIADHARFPRDRIILGGDHLGPFPWQEMEADNAMENACEMVRLFVREGYTKIHLDASMPCAGDPHPLPDDRMASRAARLCLAAESAAQENQAKPVYIIGTEVPTPGGEVEESHLSITPPQAAENTLRIHREAFLAAGLHDAWQRVIALVVQPGVDFSSESVNNYAPQRAAQLSDLLQHHDNIAFEAHSTDYQRPEALASLVHDGFRILKVGPGLTYAMRQALFALAAIEVELLPSHLHSRLPERLEQAMVAHPEHWQRHYSGTRAELHRLRVHSYSDRIRYYWADDQVRESADQLLVNLSNVHIPETLLSDYLPVQYSRVRAGLVQARPDALVFDAIGMALAPYQAACAAN